MPTNLTNTISKPVWVPLTSREVEQVRSLVLQRSGIQLDPSKKYLIDQRLEQLVLHIPNIQQEDIRRALNDVLYHDLRQKMVEAMTTNETFFFRDEHPFEMIREMLLPKLIQHKQHDKKLVIWSAACSSGQEPYSIAMMIRDYFPHLLHWDLQIFGTDLSTSMLQRAKEGTYTRTEVNRGLPQDTLSRYFQTMEDHWLLRSEVRNMVRFFELNLTRPWFGVPKVDLLLLRNVLIYFDLATRKRILESARAVLQPYGYLILGGAETPIGIDEQWVKVQNLASVCYQVRPRNSNQSALDFGSTGK